MPVSELGHHMGLCRTVHGVFSSSERMLESGEQKYVQRHSGILARKSRDEASCGGSNRLRRAHDMCMYFLAQKSRAPWVILGCRTEVGHGIGSLY